MHALTVIKAYALENLLPFISPSCRVLDVGSGSGYLTAVFYELMGGAHESNSSVVGINHLEGELKISFAAAPRFAPQRARWIKDLFVLTLCYTELTSASILNLRKGTQAAALEAGDIQIVCGDGRQGRPGSLTPFLLFYLCLTFFPNSLYI